MNNLDHLLQRTSRTFGLAIPKLPEPIRGEVTIAYLMFRVADTLEDAARWSRSERLEALAILHAVISQGEVEAAGRYGQRWADAVPIEHDGYLELLREFGRVMSAWAELRLTSRELIRTHCLRTVSAMSRFVDLGAQRGELMLRSIEELGQYCYGVAGIVGEMLTELFIHACPELSVEASGLRSRAARFGEGLQLINILRDSLADARERRFFLPAGVSVQHLWGLAEADLQAAEEYAEALQRGGAPSGIVEFALLPIALAQATLDKMKTHGPGVKISRAEVARIGEGVRAAVAAGVGCREGMARWACAEGRA
ncbi:MAG: squalene/phytoene synthase family protein [Gemmataceae bacterium]|nr:squalene/phytoene synthase family protein [Gemmataceae bacterium]